MSTSEYQTAELYISELSPHPLQAELFPEISDEEMSRFAEFLTRRRHRTNISVLSDGTIICGYRNVRAAETLHWEKIKAHVLDAETDWSDTEVLEALIADNLVGRSNDRITLARCYQELARCWDAGTGPHDGEMRDVLALKLNCSFSGRNLDRLRRLLTLPKDVVEMISDGRMKENHGHRLLAMSELDREDAFTCLRRGGKPLAVLKILKDTPNDGSDNQRREKARRVIGSIVDACEQIESRPAEFMAIQMQSAETTAQIERAARTLETLLGMGIAANPINRTV